MARTRVRLMRWLDGTQPDPPPGAPRAAENPDGDVVSDLKHQLATAHEALAMARHEAQEAARALGEASSELQSAGERRAVLERALEAAKEELAQTRAQAESDRAGRREAEQRLEALVQIASQWGAPEPLPTGGEGYGRRRGIRGLRRRGSSQDQNACSVCHTQAEGGSRALRSQGWILRKGERLCPECQENGWQFPSDATVPFRRYAERD